MLRSICRRASLPTSRNQKLTLFPSSTLTLLNSDIYNFAGLLHLLPSPILRGIRASELLVGGSTTSKGALAGQQHPADLVHPSASKSSRRQHGTARTRESRGHEEDRTRFSSTRTPLSLSHQKRTMSSTTRGPDFQASKVTEPEWEKTAKDPNALLVDVRTPEEFAEKQVPNSVNISIRMTDDPIAAFNAASQLLPADDKAKPILVYCAVGGRAQRAADALRELGYSNVKNGGGIDEVKELVVG
ncbi:unnamed protein product [Amoebophrya sp. A120]|nr:unnamed protein product [Amoebophrya sp. A120]|eukprot:GSA120T00018342001.1